MVWAAMIYALSASLLTYWIGRKLVPDNAARYAREAELRQHWCGSTSTSMPSRSPAVRPTRRDASSSTSAAVLTAMRLLVTDLTRLTWVTAGYGWVTLVIPILVAAPLYFAGNLSFGGLMMAAAAFTQLQSSLRWFVDNFSTIADWRATLLRVAVFRRALLTTAGLHSDQSRIERQRVRARRARAASRRW